MQTDIGLLCASTFSCWWKKRESNWQIEDVYISVWANVMQWPKESVAEKEVNWNGVEL